MTLFYSFPVVNAEISGGSSVISGDFTLDEAQDLANILKAGKLPAPANIIQSEIVGPSLGQEAIESGYKSFLIALGFILLYMIFYYMRAGLASNLALLLICFLYSGIVWTWWCLDSYGIAGGVLTIGMSVDANVTCCKKELEKELTQGKGLTLAIETVINKLSSIIDANITTLLTGVVLFYFGSGPIKGFATTLIIGILTSLFCAIFVTRIVFESRIESKRKVTFSNFITNNAFKNLNLTFLNNRKRYYILSATIIVVGIFSLFTKGLNQGVDFQGGRTYVVRFDNNVNTAELRNSLGNHFVNENNLKMFPVKTFLLTLIRLKITTNYMIEDLTADEIVENSLKKMFKWI